MTQLLKQLFTRLDTPENISKMGDNIPLDFPSELANPLMDYMLERSYLEDVLENGDFVRTVAVGKTRWIRIARLPIHPSNEENYDLLSRWQSALASLHAWNEKIIFLLNRKNGATSLYLGVHSKDSEKALEEGEVALRNNMPGIDLHSLGLDETVDVGNEIASYSDFGAVTGIPSFRENTQYNILQTLDKLAFGIRRKDNSESNFSLMVVAEPLQDAVITDTIAKFQQIGSDIHTEVKRTLNENKSITKSQSTEIGIGSLLSNIGTVIGANIVTAGLGAFANNALSYVLGGVMSKTASKSIQLSRSVGTEYLNKFAEYTEKLTDLHCARLRNGRNLGFWNVGVYVLGQRSSDVNVILGMLRSIYSGDKTYLEPIRIHHFDSSREGNVTAKNSFKDCIEKFNLLPLVRPDLADKVRSVWHILGEPYQYLSTPLNTEELSLVTSLPRKDVPGLRFVKTAVRFANNPGDSLGKDTLCIGHIMDTGVEQKNEYKIDINSLVRHSLIVGGTGCGKTTTCKTIINEVLGRGLPVLIIEPAKDEYVRWALEQRKQGTRINIFMPGTLGEGFSRLRLNPFQPSAIEGAPIDMLTRCEQFTALVNASLPTSDVLPVLIDETFFTYLKEQSFGVDFVSGNMQQLEGDYPKLDGVMEVAKRVMKNRGYSDEVGRGLSAALETRFTYLTRGKRGEILNVFRSTSSKKLFDEPTVINLSKLASAKDKALIMSLIILSLYEYRISAYANDADYRTKAQANKLLHLTVVEEAHNVLAKPAVDAQGTGNPQQVVADLFSNLLSEIRSYGEGLMIVDQVPTRLIPDAIKNTNYKIVHRMTAPDDCEVMEAALALRKDQTGIIPLLSQGNVLISGDKDDAASWVKVNKPLINL